MEKIPGDYVAGFVDGEGCFALKFRRDSKQNLGNKKIREYFYWGVEFAIALRPDDAEILKLIKNTLGCGSINYTKNGEQARYSVQGVRENLNKIVPFFKKHKLYAKKRHDFELWSQAIEILTKYNDGILNIQKGTRGFTKKEIKQDDLRKLEDLRNRMIKYKARREKDFMWGSVK